MLAALPAATACLAWGAWIVRDSLRAPALGIALRGDGHVDVGGERVDDFAVDWRGALTCMAWRRDGRRVRHVAWPDVVPAAARRELRLWRLVHRADASTRPVAP
jgi:toxin CptA